MMIQNITIYIVSEKTLRTVPDGTARVVDKLKKIEGIRVNVEYYNYGIGPITSVPDGAIWAAGASILSAAITAVLAYLATRSSGEIEITGSSGRSIKIPKDTPKEDIDFYIKKAEEIDAHTIVVRSDEYFDDRAGAHMNW